MIRILTAIGLLGLVACVTAVPVPKQFDLGEFRGTGKPVAGLTATVIIPDVMQPSWIRTRDIFYRLEYESPAGPQRYSMSQWVATPGELFTLRLRQAVQAANTGFTLPAATDSGGYLLQATIEEFTQVFTAPADSRCVVQLRASLWGTHGRMVAQRQFRLETAAPTADAQGAARCLASTVDALDEQLIQWLSDNTAQPR